MRLFSIEDAAVVVVWPRIVVEGAGPPSRSRFAVRQKLRPERLVLWLFARCVQQSPDWTELLEVARRLDPDVGASGPLPS